MYDLSVLEFALYLCDLVRSELEELLSDDLLLLRWLLTNDVAHEF